MSLHHHCHDVPVISPACYGTNSLFKNYPAGGIARPQSQTRRDRYRHGGVNMASSPHVGGSESGVGFVGFRDVWSTGL